MLLDQNNPKILETPHARIYFFLLALKLKRTWTLYFNSAYKKVNLNVELRNKVKEELLTIRKFVEVIVVFIYLHHFQFFKLPSSPTLSSLA